MHAPVVTARRALSGSGTFKGHYSLQADLGGLDDGESGAREAHAVVEHAVRTDMQVQRGWGKA